MKVSFPEIVKQKTDKELEQIAKDYVFYSEEERLIALNELESRNSITKEQLKSKTDIKFSMEIESGIKNIRSVSRGKRFLNYLIDSIFIGIFTFILLMILYTVLYFISPEIFSVLDIFFKNKSPLFITVFRGLTQAIIWIIYYSLSEGLTGRSLSKYITKTKVVNEKGEKPDFKTILLRTICREPFSFLGSQRTGWHDEWSKTIVVAI